MIPKVIKSDKLKGDIKTSDNSRNRVGVTDLVGEGGGVLNKKVLDATDKAAKIIDDAEAKAAEIKSEAEKILEEAKIEKEAEKKRGFEMGKKEAMASVTEKAVKLEHLKEKFVKQAEPGIIKLVMEMVEKIIGKLVFEHEGVVKSVVHQALESSLGDRIVVHLNPEDYDVVTKDDSEFKDILDRTKRLSFRRDESVMKGGCVVETEVGTIDAQLDVQLKAISKVLEI
ncbi:hypothetical protein KKA47_04750 [bacterium]|nr:hypothetical protein [bacterium]